MLKIFQMRTALHFGKVKVPQSTSVSIIQHRVYSFLLNKK